MKKQSENIIAVINIVACAALAMQTERKCLVVKTQTGIPPSPTAYNIAQYFNHLFNALFFLIFLKGASHIGPECL